MRQADRHGWYLFPAGALIAATGIFVCVRALGRQLRRLDDARVAAEAGSRAKSQFLAATSHELRTPLNSIVGFSEILANERLGPIGSAKYLEYVRYINESGSHLLSLVNGILDLARIEAGHDPLEDETLDIRHIVDFVVMMVRGRAEEGGVELELDVADTLPLLRADQRRLTQIFLNLMTNAIKFTKPGGKVTLRARCDAKTGHLFEVIDTGIGIAEADIPRALSQFGRIDSDPEHKYEGTGIGLTLTMSLVESHGGSLDLRSELGLGTAVTVRFPATRIEMRAEHATTPMGKVA